MGPLFPEIIGNELNIIIALVIGLFFGIILEQAGFSTPKKLVGLFYGYDFTVLRVFFTAGIVAMAGLILFDHYGIIDINLIYINPTYLYSAIVGGLIMGLGFVIGGYCPGTSVCAAAIGKIDAMVFVLGSAIGVLIFMEGYPLFEDLYKAEFWGYERMFDTFGISQTLFAFLLTAIALFAFWAVSIIENKVNGIEKKAIRFTPYYAGLAGIGIVLLFSASMHPSRKDHVTDKVADEEFVDGYKVDVMTADELAFRIIDGDNRLQIVDFRKEKDFEKFRLPFSRILTEHNLFEKEPSKFLSYRKKINVFLAEDEATAKRIAVQAHELGFKNIKILGGGLDNFKKVFLNSSEILAGTSLSDSERFRNKARTLLPAIIEKNKNKGVVKAKKSKRVLGGC